MLQLSLDMLQDPPPDNGVWNSLNEEQRAILIDALTRLIAKTPLAGQNPPPLATSNSPTL